MIHLVIKEWLANQTEIKAVPNKEFWSFNGSSSEERSDWILPVNKGFYKKNYLGMNDSDYGGGIPVSAVWRERLWYCSRPFISYSGIGLYSN